MLLGVKTQYLLIIAKNDHSLFSKICLFSALSVCTSTRGMTIVVYATA
jgi:hypothetical protein